jgi:DNA-binding MarR family transcriptional regulator
MDETREQAFEYSPVVRKLAKQVGLHIVRSSRFLLPRMNQEMLTQSQAFVLDLLLEKEQPWRLSDLAGAAGVRLPSMTDLVSRMERQGWIRKEGTTHDRRGVAVTLTSEGRAVIQDFERRQIHLIAQRLVLLSTEDQATIEQALPALTRLFNSSEEGHN